MLKDVFKTKAGATLIGVAIAVFLFYFPEAKAIACGGGFTLPFMLGGN